MDTHAVGLGAAHGRASIAPAVAAVGTGLEGRRGESEERESEEDSDGELHVEEYKECGV
ncbi:hypothetical protein PHLCEN_2v12752 [Hermanssonia centrifuga]|uniref:Uncharacterized protein n=1 Tax=Hermanssonia centrifuga TaxID=98765 RepID=A0A2R6NG91_9APHY|nr:hypothetical protein PHLCEN_2v12752 [Hermanssonia centrifuga]